MRGGPCLDTSSLAGPIRGCHKLCHEDHAEQQPNCSSWKVDCQLRRKAGKPTSRKAWQKTFRNVSKHFHRPIYPLELFPIPLSTAKRLAKKSHVVSQRLLPSGVASLGAFFSLWGGPMWRLLQCSVGWGEWLPHVDTHMWTQGAIRQSTRNSDYLKCTLSPQVDAALSIPPRTCRKHMLKSLGTSKGPGSGVFLAHGIPALLNPRHFRSRHLEIVFPARGALETLLSLSRRRFHCGIASGAEIDFSCLLDIGPKNNTRHDHYPVLARTPPSGWDLHYLPP